MSHSRFSLIVLAVALLAWAFASSDALSRAADEIEEGFGSITGQFVVEGTVPPPRLLVAKGDTKVFDAPICAASDLMSEELLVDGETSGLANVFIYLPKGTKIAGELEPSAAKEFVVDIKGCRFAPHALVVRTDQTVVFKSEDGCTHCPKGTQFRSDPFSFVVARDDRTKKPIRLQRAESFPNKVECQIHPWMSAYWLIQDHPYAATSDSQGRFQIADLPAREHQFILWHEKRGYLDRRYKVTVKAGKTVNLGKIVVPAEKLIEKQPLPIVHFTRSAVRAIMGCRAWPTCGTLRFDRRWKRGTIWREPHHESNDCEVANWR